MRNEQQDVIEANKYGVVPFYGIVNSTLLHEYQAMIDYNSLVHCKFLVIFYFVVCFLYLMWNSESTIYMV